MHSVASTPTPRGRPRDAAIDRSALAAARRLLGERGVGGLTIDEVARAAGTTRQAVYRRWPTKRALAAAALASMEDDGPAAAPVEPLAALIAELEDFRAAVSRPGRLSLVGTMLQTATDEALRARYQQRVIRPRRRRLRDILERAVREGALPADGDLEVAVTMLTGSWYARCLAGDDEPSDWARRAALLVWASLGGVDHPGEAVSPPPWG
ncbi:MAG: TetR/AcrR family transcriptional regulator [Thermoleophilia bacterium]